MLQNASYMLKKKTKQNKTKRLRKKEKILTRRESNPRPSTCKGNVLSIAPRNHCQYHFQINNMLGSRAIIAP